MDTTYNVWQSIAIHDGAWHDTAAHSHLQQIRLLQVIQRHVAVHQPPAWHVFWPSAVAAVVVSDVVAVAAAVVRRGKLDTNLHRCVGASMQWCKCACKCEFKGQVDEGVYVCMCVCLSVRMHARMYVCTFACTYVRMHVRPYVRMHGMQPDVNRAYHFPEQDSLHVNNRLENYKRKMRTAHACTTCTAGTTQMHRSALRYVHAPRCTPHSLCAAKQCSARSRSTHRTALHTLLITPAQHAHHCSAHTVQ